MVNPIDYQLKNLSMMSLEDISLRRVAVLLCSDAFNHSTLNVCCEINIPRVEVIKSSVTKLWLPEPMKERLVNTLNPILMEITKWFQFHEEFFKLYHSRSYYPGCIKHIQWTQIGTINYGKTAEAMVRDEKLDVDQRFTLACMYCLDGDIRELWRKLSPKSQNRFFDNGIPCRYGTPIETVILWACNLKGRVGKLGEFLSIRRGGRYSSVDQYAFESFADSGNETAARFFFEKLGCREQSASLVRTAQTVARGMYPNLPPHSNVLCFLLSQMNEKQLQTFLESSACAILKCFMEWPRQKAFPEVAKLALPYLKADHYKQLYSFLTRKFNCLYNSPELFRDIFLITPTNLKHTVFYLNNFFRNRDTETIQFMLRNMDPEETLGLFLKDITLHNCRAIMIKGEWNFLEFFIRESRLSKEGRERFAAEINSNCSSPSEREIGKRFTEMMNRISADTSKCDISNCNEVNLMDPKDFQPSGQLDEELTERPAKKSKRLKKQIIMLCPYHKLSRGRIRKHNFNFLGNNL